MYPKLNITWRMRVHDHNFTCTEGERFPRILNFHADKQRHVKFRRNRKMWLSRRRWEVGAVSKIKPPLIDKGVE